MGPKTLNVCRQNKRRKRSYGSHKHEKEDMADGRGTTCKLKQIAAPKDTLNQGY